MVKQGGIKEASFGRALCIGNKAIPSGPDAKEGEEEESKVKETSSGITVANSKAG